MQTKKKRKIKTAILCLCMGIASACPAKVIHVDTDATGANNGSTWADAYNYLQDALADANSAAKPVDVRVAQGTYRPDEDTLHPDGTGDRDATLQLINGVTLKGGYAGFNQLDPNVRDIDTYKTILSGDINRDDVNLDSNDSCHVVKGADDATLDGFTIEHGYASGKAEWEFGGGMYNWSNSEGTITIRNCTFRDNFAEGGGAMCNRDRSNVSVTDCTFEDNKADWAGAMYNCADSDVEVINCTFTNNEVVAVYWGDAGAMANQESRVMLENCLFTGNKADYVGGAIANKECDSGYPKLTNCVFTGNEANYGAGMSNYKTNATLNSCVFSGNIAVGDGGGMENGSSSDPNLTNCVFSGNEAGQWGGGIANLGYCDPTLTNCTFSGNTAVNHGGGISSTHNPTITNCIFWGNTDGDSDTVEEEQIYDGGTGTPTVSYSCVQGLSAFSGNGNIGDDPKFMDPDGLDDTYSNDIQLTNSILWNDGNEIWNNDGSDITVSYSEVRRGENEVYDPCNGVIWGEGNIDADPCFADPGYWDTNGTPEDANDDFWVDGDYHLKSQAGRWEPPTQDWVLDDVTSPCIDAGDPMNPIGPEPFPNGGIINMGAYGGTVEASKSYFGKPPCEIIVAGDINGDCEVSFLDFRLMGLHWLEDR